MKKLLKLFLVAVMAFAIVGCSSSGATEVLIGVSPDYPPYESLDGDKLVGFDIEMTEELFKIMNENGGNYTYKFNQMTFDTISTSILSDQIDLGISGFTHHPEWENVIWSDPYNDSRQVAIVAADSDMKTKDDLKGKSIGAQLATTGAGVARGIEGAQVKTVKDVKVLIETLNSGGIQAVILDEAVAESYVKENGYKMLEGTLLEEENLILAKKGNEKLIEDINKALDEFVKSEKYQELKTKWGA